MREKLLWLSKALVYATFVVPLVVVPSSFIFPFIVPKILLFRALVTFLLASYALLLVVNWEEFKPKFTPVTIALSLFILSFGISTFAGADWYHSFWDNHERMLGLFTLVHYLIYYFIVTSVFTSWTQWRLALRLFLMAGCVVMIIGLLQVLNPDLLMNQGSDRVAATLGNAIYVGGYGLFLAFVAYLLYSKDDNVVWKALEAIAGLLGLLGMFYSGTRGSMLGFAAGVGILIIGYIVTLKQHPRVRTGLIAALGASLVLVGILYSYRHTTFVQHIPAIGRTFNTGLADVQNSPRWIAWTIAWQSFKEKPVFGWGPNNFFYAFNKYYNPKSLEFGYSETWFDNAHNIIMNTLAVQGAFGLITYLALFVISWYCLVRALRNKKIDVHVALVGCAFLVAHLVQNITVFENPTSYLYFMFWLAFVNWSTAPKAVEPALAAQTLKQSSKDKVPAAIDKNVSGGVMMVTMLVALLFVFVFELQPARANMKTLLTLQLFSSDPAAGLGAAKEAIAFNSPHIDDIRNDLARSFLPLLATANVPGFDDVKKTEGFNLMYNELQKNHLLHPFDIRIQLTLAQMAQTYAGLSNNVTYALDVEKYLDDALRLSPKRQQIIYGLAGIKAQLGKVDEAVALLKQSIADDPKIVEGYWRLAYTYKALGKQNEYQAVMASLQQAGLSLSPDQEQSLQQLQVPQPTPAKVKK